MSTKCFAPVRGSVIRATMLDSCGEPDVGQSAVVVSKRVSSIAIEEVSDDGTNIRDRNFGGELLIVDDAFTETLGFNTNTTLCGVDPGLVSLMSRQPVVVDALGDIVGFDVKTGIDMDDTAFALEVWSKLAGSACDPSGHRLWGYTVFPFLKGGRLGNFSFENSAVQFSIQGAQTREGNAWGVGPFNVTRDENGDPAPMHTPLDSDVHYRPIVVNLDPPVASCGAFPLAAGSF